MISRLVIEGDEICYKVAWSAQKTGYRVNFSDGNIIDWDTQHSKTSLKSLYAGIGLVEGTDYTLESYLKLGSRSLVVDGIRAIINRLRDLHNHDKATEFNIRKIDELQIFISPEDKSNFRFSVAKTEGKKGVGYKAGRADKPAYINYAKTILQEMYGAKQAYGYEADDYVSMFHDNNSVLVSVDKDLDIVPGVHYNINYNRLYMVDTLGGFERNEKNKMKAYGLTAFYQQLLTGDDIDNIPACEIVNSKKQKRHTMKTACNLLQKCNSEIEMVNIVVSEYKNTYQELWKERLLEIADLVWMVRQKGVHGSNYILNKLGE